MTKRLSVETVICIGSVDKKDLRQVFDQWLPGQMYDLNSRLRSRDRYSLRKLCQGIDRTTRTRIGRDCMSRTYLLIDHLQFGSCRLHLAVSAEHRLTR